MRKVLTFMSAFLLGLSGLFMAPVMAMADSAPSPAPTIGYAVGDAVLGTGGSVQHLTFSMIDRSSGDRGTVSYTNASAAIAYNASVMAVAASNSGARFAYTIPSTAPASVSGLIIVWQVKDSSPDTAAFSVAATASRALTMVTNGFTPSNSYTVSSGGLDTARTSSTGLRGYTFGNAAFGTSPRQHLAFAVLDYGPTMDTGVAFYVNLDMPVLYEAATPVVRVAYGQARFDYTIPAGFGGLSGLSLARKVANGTPDTAGFSVASSATAAAMVNAGFTPAYAYGITGGDLTVVQLYVLLGHATGGVWFGPVVGFSVASSLTAARWMVLHGFTPTNQYTVTHGNLTVHMP